MYLTGARTMVAESGGGGGVAALSIGGGGGGGEAGRGASPEDNAMRRV